MKPSTLILATALAVSSTAAARPTAALWHNYENNADDSNGSNHGALEGGASFSNTAKVGDYSLHLDGDGDYVKINTPLVRSSFVERTVALWIKPDSTSGTQILFEEGAAIGMALRIKDNKLEAVYAAQSGVLQTLEAPISGSNWVHVAIVAQESGFELFKNGVSVDSLAGPLNEMRNHGNPGAIGGRAKVETFGSSHQDGSPNPCFAGLIDDFLIFDSALMATEVADLMTYTPPVVPPAATVVTAQPGVHDWSDPATWGGSVPANGEDVDIPVGSTVTLDTDTANLGVVEVNGTLRFADEDLNLTAHHILVQGMGSKLQIGLPGNKYTDKAVITLTGSDPLKEILTSMGHESGSKGLVVAMGGTLDVHGAQADALDWTQLDQTAEIGHTSITLKDNASSWRAGDEIVIAPSGFDPNEAERVTITAVNNKTVSFTPALQYRHWGTLQTIEGATVDERAEVGLLTRDIVIQGDSTSDANQMGGHVMVMHGGFAQVQGVEFRKMGQMRRPGRYSFHWHLAGDLTGQWIKHCSIHDGFNRAVVTHASENGLVESNVSYNIWSHHYVPSEDGTEFGNYYKNNLGILAKGLEEADFSFPGHKNAGNQSEARPAVFWMVRVNQKLEGNHAVGLRQNVNEPLGGFGFMYDWVNRHADQPDAEVTLFRDNVAHTIEGERTQNIGYQPNHSGSGLFATAYTPSPAKEQIFGDFLAYKCAAYGVWFTEEDNTVINTVSADTGAGLFGMRGLYEDSLFIGSTANDVGGAPLDIKGDKHIGVFTTIKIGKPKTFRLRNVKFVNWRDEAICWAPKHTSLGNLYENITIVNCGDRIVFTNDYDSSVLNAEDDGYLLDLDGSLSQTGVPTAIFSNGQTIGNANSVYNAARNYWTHPLVDGAVTVVDNQAATLEGSWVTSNVGSGYQGANYLTDNNQNKGVLAAIYEKTTPTRGWYRIEIKYPTGTPLANNVPLDLQWERFVVELAMDQTIGGGSWQTVDFAELETDEELRLTIGNAGTSTKVAADAVRFVKLQLQ